jgi:uncharacterized membrane protein YbhN (UPF0104 family)
VAEPQASAAAQAPPGRTILPLLLRLAVAVALLLAAVRLALPGEGESLVASLASAWIAPLPAALACFALAGAIFGASFAVVAWRFVVLLRAVGLRASWSATFRAYVIANFLNLVLPTAFLSDVYRVADARHEAGRVSEVLAMVALERVLSFAALGVVVLAAAPFVPFGEARRALPILLLLAGGLLAASLAVLHPRLNALLRRLVAPLARLSARLAGAADRALAAVEVLGGRRGAVLQAFLLSVLAQALPVAAVAVLARPLDSELAWFWYAAIVPFITLLTLIPISIGGAGVREVLFVRLFEPLGMRPEVALSLSLSVFAVTLAWGVVGIALLAWGRRHPAVEGAPAP